MRGHTQQSITALASRWHGLGPCDDHDRRFVCTTWLGARVGVAVPAVRAGGSSRPPGGDRAAVAPGIPRGGTRAQAATTLCMPLWRAMAVCHACAERWRIGHALCAPITREVAAARPRMDGWMGPTGHVPCFCFPWKRAYVPNIPGLSWTKTLSHGTGCPTAHLAVTSPCAAPLPQL